MQTVYYTTRNFIRSTGNVVDLAEYRRKLAQAEGSLAPVPQHAEHTEPSVVRPFPAWWRAPPRKSPEKFASSPACLWTVWPASACC